jgi:membrane fusion protein (multidrug efflux system)
MGKGGLPPATVSAMKAEYQVWQPQLNAVGTLRAVRGVDVTTEVAGLVRSINFKSGDEVKTGQVLAQLNADSDIAQLHSLEAAAELASTVYERDKAQLAAEVISKAQVDTDAGDLKSKRAQVAQQQAVVEKKTLRAPFAGKLGISIVNPGQYLNPADKLVTLQTLDPIYVDFYLPQQQLPQVAIGQALTLTTDTYPGVVFTGKINAINSKIDANTRNVQVEATIPNAKRQLLPGMFASVRVNSGEENRYLTLPQTAITFNPYGNTVFVVKASDKKEDKDDKGNPRLSAQQVFVTTGPTRGDQVAILKGIEPGAQVVTSGQVKLKNGTPLIIDNKVQPSNSPDPKPQEQ